MNTASSQSNDKNNESDQNADPGQARSNRNPKLDRLKNASPNRIIRRLVMISLIAVAGLFLLSMSASEPSNLGLTNRTLAKCPSSPNCVSTQAERPEQQMPAVRFEGSAVEMLEKIKQKIQSDYPRAQLVREADYYLHYEFKSLVFRFVDDVEFFVDDTASVVHFRSASRVGHSDMGKNRKRMKKISESLDQ